MLRGRGGEERGSVAITVVLTMTVLLGFAALVVDIGLNWAARTSAQTAADAAALAGVSRLLDDGPAGALLGVESFLDANVDGLVPGAAGWATDGSEANGEVVCWVLPAGPPGPGAGCPDGSNALQVTTPPIQVQYAFAPVLGQSSNSIRARAAAAAGPAAPNNCVLCLLDPAAPAALESLGFGDVTVNGGGIAVNSSNVLALVAAGAGDISATQIRVIGGFSDPGMGNLFPPAELGGPPVPDPLADLLTPDLLGSPPIPRDPNPIVVDADRTLPPGIYNTVRVEGTATLTLQTGVFVFTGLDGLTVADDARVVSSAGGATIYLACGGYPAPCSGLGARFRVQDRGRFQANPPNSGPYAGLSIFAARGNTTTMNFRSRRNVTLPGVLYGPSTRVSMEGIGDLQVNSLLVVGALSLTTVPGPDASVTVNYSPSVLLPGVGGPVLIR
jgi:hypothetical protein